MVNGNGNYNNGIKHIKGHWSRIRQIWQTHKGGDMDQEDSMGQALTYWRPQPEVSPDEDFHCEVETSITKYVILVV